MITHKNIGYGGRLGNQMFQYAALKSVALENSFDFFLPNNLTLKLDGAFDFTNNKWTSLRLDLLDGFNINESIIDSVSNHNMTNSYSENSFTYNPDIFNIQDNTIISGYFQSYKYFDKYANSILTDFKFKSHILEKCSKFISRYTNTVSVHIRRGDYVKHPGYWVVTTEYLQNALNYFSDHDYTFLVFSDDIQWCKEIFPNEVIFIEGNNQFEDLCLMSLCEHNIISNSTFSWWGAFLNQNPNKKVVAPKNWFTSSKSIDDLYPDNWIVI